MNQTELKQVKRLLVLADAAADFEHVDITLVTHFHVMREELGLAKLLLLIQEYIEHETVNKKLHTTPNIHGVEKHETSL